MKSRKFIRVFSMAAALCMMLGSCGDRPYKPESGTGSQISVPASSESSESSESGPAVILPEKETDTEWAVYWYLCGSDLETFYGSATEDLYELEETVLPENVRVVVQTGGAAAWFHEQVYSEQTGRYLYSSEGLTEEEICPEANMGDPETLADFLRYCRENHPARHEMVIIWNHGGGSVSGAAFDEVYWNDSLTLTEMREAFQSVYGVSEEDPPLDAVGFDACLMATADTAAAFQGIARYLVASEELEPGCGWNYSSWVQALGDRPEMTMEELGQVICDSYAEGCEEIGCGDDITLSVTDLQKAGKMLEIYEMMGREALSLACEDPLFFADFGREAMRTENYGGNNEDEGYTNLADLGHLVRNAEHLLPLTGEQLLAALEECVVYQIRGDYRQEASGLSCYYSYSGDYDELLEYETYSASESFWHLYDYELSGDLSEEGRLLAEELGYEELQEIIGAGEFHLEDFPLYTDEEGYAVLDIGDQAASRLTGIYFQLSCYSPEEDFLLVLGRDNNIIADWENGIFKDNFQGTWGSIDGHLCYMELTADTVDYNKYTVPILLNGEDYNLHVAYDFGLGEYEILGARQSIDPETGMADKNLRQLKPGDEITTLHYGMFMDGESEMEMIPAERITVTENTSFYDVDMGDGAFLLFYEMVDLQGESFYSDVATYTVEDGIIYTQTD